MNQQQFQAEVMDELRESMENAQACVQMNKDMRRAHIEYEVSEGDHDAEYADFIMQRSAGEVLVCNGDDLIRVMESGRYFDSFCDYMESK